MGNRPWPIPRSLPVCPDPARIIPCRANPRARSEEHTSELQSQSNIVCRLLLEKKKKDVLIGLTLNSPDARNRSDGLRRTFRDCSQLKLQVPSRPCSIAKSCHCAMLRAVLTAVD